MDRIASQPYLTAFNPTIIPYQYEVIRDIRAGFDYSIGSHEILLSGSYGSAKSTLMAHIVVTHCLATAGARAFLGRLSMPDLKRTIFAEILDHIGRDLKEGRDYTYQSTNASIRFSNGSEIISGSWSDKRYKKFRSLKLSLVCLEELVESDTNEAFFEIKARLRRIPGVRENLLIAASNPDSPAHWAYDYFIAPNEHEDHPTRHVYYSNTFDNPFLDPVYIQQLKRDLDPKSAERYIFGKWIELAGDTVYHAYGSHNQRLTEAYEIQPDQSIYLSFDFNIGEGKPMSMCLSQVEHTKKGPVFHFFADVVVDGADTESIMEEIAGRGHLDHDCPYVIHGDATGGSRTTKSKVTDYDIITAFLAKYRGSPHGKLEFEKKVGRANPPIRTRHNAVNGYCKNMLGDVRLYVYKGAPTLDKGLRLTALKKGGQYIEDDSKPYQHVTTAAGYHIAAIDKEIKSQKSGLYRRQVL